MRKWRSLLFFRRGYLLLPDRCLFFMHGNYYYEDDHRHDQADVMIMKPDEGAAIKLMYHPGNY